ncbi:hypothetical protein BDY17DRAFT_292633 [Neohortaea acidophila]|uniref:MYND-type domain-containing protein n=1 Tax=Neohortaea acidophila TaxID=245834 RepID=A0A6A6PYV5_9PEZI|nr:uncharacterized protein BDY17DRAFT_292633 [Neohortaea acidophila]KAF2484946.1 hypothetical protein BDY17DRAFT_292633 [Neohortaea acidophila]
MATNGQELDECSNCRATQSTDGTPLSTCAKCHSRKYCSCTCQAERWPFHKTFCGKTPIQAVDDRSPPTEQMRGYGIVTTPLPSLSPEYRNVCGHHMCTSAPSSWVHNAPVWIDVPISTAVGMPMRMLAAPVTSALRAFTNGTVNALGIDIDPTSATFGEIHWASNQPPMGECLLVRVDGRTFHMTHVMALYRYAREKASGRSKRLPGRRRRGRRWTGRLLWQST